MRVGVVSDTHGYVNPRLGELLAGVELILHAGDICGSHVLAALERIAPVVAVAGNNDVKHDTCGYPAEQVLEILGQRFLLVHQYTPVRPRRGSSPATGRSSQFHPPHGVDAVVFGHSHRALNQVVDGVLFFNPGAACKPRFRDVPSIGILTVVRGSVTGTILPL